MVWGMSTTYCTQRQSLVSHKTHKIPGILRPFPYRCSDNIFLSTINNLYGKQPELCHESMGSVSLFKIKVELIIWTCDFAALTHSSHMCWFWPQQAALSCKNPLYSPNLTLQCSSFTPWVQLKWRTSTHRVTNSRAKINVDVIPAFAKVSNRKTIYIISWGCNLSTTSNKVQGFQSTSPIILIFLRHLWPEGRFCVSE